MRRVILHIGPHRTGTTSFQQFLCDQRDGALARIGLRYPPGLLWETNQSELTLGCLSEAHIAEMSAFTDFAIERLAPDLPRALDPAWRQLVADSIAANAGNDCIYSAESLSWIASSDEVDRLLALFPQTDVSIVIVRRDPVDFMASYRSMARFMTTSLSEDPTSIWYVEPDSWLADITGRVELWTAAVGADRVHAIDFETAVAADGSILPALCRAIGLDRGIDGIDGTALDAYHLNSRIA